MKVESKQKLFYIFIIKIKVMIHLKTFNFDFGFFIYQYETHNNKSADIYEYCQTLNEFLKAFNNEYSKLNFSMTFTETSLTSQIIFNLVYEFNNKKDAFDVCSFDFVSSLIKETIEFAITCFYPISWTYDTNNFFYKFKKETIDKGIDYNLNGDNYCFIKLFDADNLSGFIMQDTDY